MEFQSIKNFGKHSILLLLQVCSKAVAGIDPNSSYFFKENRELSIKQCTRSCTQKHEEVHMPFVKGFFNGKRGRPTCKNGGPGGGLVPNRVMPAIGSLDTAMYNNAKFDDECKAYKVSKSCLEKLIKECDECTPIAKKQLESVKNFLKACPGS